MDALTRSQQDYLKALYVLGPEGERVAPSRLAQRLAVSAPSVTHMLQRLSAEGWVRHAPRGAAQLTARGRRVAVDMVRRHRILETFLVRVLGLDWSEVHADAEVLEHHISDRVLDAIDRLVGHPEEDPHGHVIPDRTGKVRSRTLRSLAALPPGASATVREIRETESERMIRWREAGLVPGAAVRMIEVRGAEDLYEVEVAGSRIVMGRQGLEGVLVEGGRPSRTTAVGRARPRRARRARSTA